MAKRVNKRFLIVMTSVVAAAVVAAMAIHFIGVFRKDPAAQERAGDKLLQEGKPKAALDKYKYAIARDPNNKGLLVKIGDTYNHMVADEPQTLHHARAVWSQAVAADPRYEPALQRLLDSYWEQMEGSSLEGELYSRARESAQRLSGVRAADTTVAAKVHIATIRPWLDGLLNVFPKAEVDKSVEQLSVLMARDRANAEIPYYYALAQLKYAQEWRKGGRPQDEPEIERLTALAGRTMDAAVAEQPNNAAMQLRAYQVYTLLDAAERAKAAMARAEAARAAAPGAAPPVPVVDAEAETPSGAKARKALDAALAAAKELKPADPLFADIHIAAARFAIADRRPADAEKIYEELLARVPDDQNVRIHYAALLTSSGEAKKRDKAIELLSSEVNVSKFTGVRGFLAAQLRAKTLIDLIDARMEQARIQQDDKKRKDILATAKSDLDKLSVLINADSVPVLRARGRMQQLEGNPIESIRTFERAVNLMQGSKNKDFNLVNDLATAYIFAGQTGSAKELLQEVIDRHEWFVPARLQMAQVLITENKINEAKIQLNQAEKQLRGMQGQAEIKELPQWQERYQRTALALLAKVKDPQLDEKFAQMPERNRAERMGKAGIAQVLKKYDDAVRLGGLVLAENAADMNAVDIVANAHLAAGRKSDALAVVDRALAANPPDLHAQKLKMAREKIVAQIELANASPEEVYQRNKQLIEQEPESPDRAVKLATLALRHAGTKIGEDAERQKDEAEAVLLKAHGADPKNVPVLSRLFELAIQRQQWDKAKALCDKLVATKGDGADGLLYQFRLATAREDKAEALRIGKAVRDARPEFDLGYVAYGQALQANERFAEALDQYKQARSRKPLNFDALKGMVECSYKLQRPEDARVLIDEARGLFPENPLFKDLELNHELQFGDPLAVVTEREEIHRQQPEDRENWLELASAYRTVAWAKFRGDAARRAEMLGKARDVLVKAAERWKDDSEIVASLAAVMSETGDFAGGEKLLADFARAPGREAKTEPLLVLADYYVRGEQFAKAEAVSREALRRAETPAGGQAPDLRTAVSIRLRLAEFLSRYRRHDDALAVLDGAVTGGGGAQAAELDKLVFRQRLQVLVAADRRDLAERMLLDALAKPATANDPDLQLMLISVNFEGGKYDEALERLNRVLKADPGNIKLLFLRGQILLRQPRPDIAKALEDLTEVRKRDPNSAGARLLLADAYTKRGDMNLAIRELQDGLRLQPLSRELRLKLIDYYSSSTLSDPAEVLRLAREARDRLELKDDAVWAYREALVYTQRRDWPSATKAIQDAIQLAPGDMSLRREQQNIMLLAGQNKEVLEMTEAMAREGKAPWWVHQNRARARHGTGDATGAVAEFNAALTAAGDNNAAVQQVVYTMVSTVGKDQALQQVLARANREPRWKLLAAALYSARAAAQPGGAAEPPNWEKAVQMLDEVQAHFNELSPVHQAQALRIAGPMYQMAKPPQFEKAKQTYEQLLKLNPDDLFALNNLANLLVDDALVPQPQEARKHSQHAYDLVKRAQPFPAAIFDTHGWVLVHCGELTEAIEILQKVVRQSNMPEAHYHLGEAYVRKGDFRKAQESLKVAAQAIPEVIAQGGTVSADLEKKIQASLEKANQLEGAAKGGQAGAR
jgi:tetratricopeptide (TPR) repeat protein